MWCVRETRRQSCVRPVGRRGRRGGSPGPAARGCSLQWARRERFSSGLVRLRFGGLWSTLRSVSHLTAWNAKEVLHAELDEAAAKVRADVRWEPTVTHLLSLSLSVSLPPRSTKTLVRRPLLCANSSLPHLPAWQHDFSCFSGGLLRQYGWGRRRGARRQ